MDSSVQLAAACVIIGVYSIIYKVSWHFIKGHVMKRANAENIRYVEDPVAIAFGPEEKTVDECVDELDGCFKAWDEGGKGGKL